MAKKNSYFIVAVSLIGARLTKFPPVGRLVKHFFFDGDFAVYLPHKKAQKGQVKVVLPDAVVNYFIEQASFRFQMNGCVCRETNRCQNYPPDLGCLFLGEAARGINPALGREVGVAEAKAIQKRVDELGLINMVGKLRLDRVLLAVSPGERLLTICHCCECCCLFNLLPYLATPIGARFRSWTGLRSRWTGPAAVVADASKPALPGLSALKREKPSSEKQCRGCGRCVTSCPAEAITLIIEKDDFIEESILRIRSYVQVD